MRKLGVTFMATAALFVAAAAVAFACTNLATLNLSESHGQPGATVDVTGSSFAAPESGGQDVVIHWNAADGPVLAKARPDATGNISTSVAIPQDAAPGFYVLIATQNEKDSETGEVSAVYGTPARASFLVGSALPPEVNQPAASTTVAAETTSSGLIALTIILAAAGIGLFGAGLGLFVREIRRRAAPAPVRK